MPENQQSKRIGRWYFGGLASAGAACCTHPLDLLKVSKYTLHLIRVQDSRVCFEQVHLQTAGTSEKIGVVRQTVSIVRNQGVLALYNGLSASLVRQLTYSTTRFAIYEVSKQRVAPNGEAIPFSQRVAMAGVAGAMGGFVGTPGDMVNVRMQNDIKLPVEKRRKSVKTSTFLKKSLIFTVCLLPVFSYKHAIDGLMRVAREEGFRKLFNGADWASTRAVLVTIGQLSFYDLIKGKLLATGQFQDNLTTHFTSSLCAVWGRNVVLYKVIVLHLGHFASLLSRVPLPRP